MCNSIREHLAEYNETQIREMLGPDNMWFAGIQLSRPPTKEDAIWHYLTHGGAENFRKKWLDSHNENA